MKKNEQNNNSIKNKRKPTGRKIFDPVTEREREHNRKLEEE